ncbi:hypothetical protein SLEP1_g39523 [Rubroshorea leprosula]|uniref:Reverse transcriptase Ty1/copia-type domain-containing protein n=1 Tax=Rubroshorea leprosula TaxID=152421 RepID=A0AAV5L0G0_9ROSI|nr:hypothetical protein SLEP1_g39523 [Rubroshorea leprosula]
MDSDSSSSETNAINPNSTATVINNQRGPFSFNVAAFPLKFTPTNYLSWKSQFTCLLAGFELLGYLDGSHPSPVATEPSYSLWARQDQLIRHALITSVSDSITPYIATTATAQQAWETLARLYANRSRTRVITLKECLQNMRRDGRSVSEYLRALKSVADELGTIDRPLTDDDLTVYILNGLGPEFREIATSLRTRDSSLSFDDLHDRLVAHEESLRREELKADSSPITAHHASILKSMSSSQLCNQAGHFARSCLYHRIQNLNPQANYASSATAADDWLLDSGATNHVTTDLANLALHSEYHGPDELQIGDGTVLNITHVGHTTLSTPSYSLPLKDILCVLQASRNLISVSQLCKSADVFVEFHPTFFLVKDRRTRETLLRGKNTHGVYHIPGQVKAQPAALVGERVSLANWHSRLESTFPFKNSTFLCDASNSSPTCRDVPMMPNSTSAGMSVEPPPLFPCVPTHTLTAHLSSIMSNKAMSNLQLLFTHYLPLWPLAHPLPFLPLLHQPLPLRPIPSTNPLPHPIPTPPLLGPHHRNLFELTQWFPPPQPLRTHPMVTRSQNNIFKPKTLFHATKSPLSLPVEPTCATQALKDPNWRQAMSEEFSALVRQGTWELVPSHPSQHVLGCKWVFRLKRGKDGSIKRYKARLVAKGFHQRPGSDYFNTFSPVIKPTTIHTVLSLAVSRGWSIQQLDVNNAFLHGHIDEVLYMQQPTGFVDHNFPSHVCRLRKSLYGLKQAPRAWFRALKDFLLAQGFFHSKSDNSLFIYHKGSTWIYFLVYVDDIIVTGNDSAPVQSIMQVMSATFSLKDLGPLSFFLGIEAISTKDGLFLSQQRYILDLLQKTGMADAKPVSSPLASTSVLQLSTGTPLSDGTNYRKIVGSLQYLSLTWPDLSFAVSRLSQFMHRPTDSHWQAVKRVLRYLRGSVSHGLLLRPQPTLSLHAFSDADWAGDRDTYTSTTGYLVFLGSNPLSWRAAKQQAVARSSTEAEYRALATAASEVVWIQHLLSELGVSSSIPPAILCDNIGATYLSSNLVFHSWMKHIAIDLHFVRELVDRKVLHVSHISSHDQLADALTKALPSLRFRSLRSKIGVADGTFVLRGHIKETKSAAIK